MVTYSFTTNGVAGSADFETLQEAFDAAGADVNANRTRAEEEKVIAVSIDDHEGNVYDAEAIRRKFAPPGPGRGPF
jgi:hypothetical protein